MGMGRAGGAMASVSPWPIRPYRASDGRFIARLAAVTFLLPLPIGITGTWVLTPVFGCSLTPQV